LIASDRRAGRYSERVVVVAQLHRWLRRPVRRRVDSTSTTEPAPAFVVLTLLTTRTTLRFHGIGQRHSSLHYSASVTSNTICSTCQATKPMSRGSRSPSRCSCSPPSPCALQPPWSRGIPTPSALLRRLLKSRLTSCTSTFIVPSLISPSACCSNRPSRSL
jgi:hypothetical protein